MEDTYNDTGDVDVPPSSTVILLSPGGRDTLYWLGVHMRISLKSTLGTEFWKKKKRKNTSKSHGGLMNASAAIELGLAAVQDSSDVCPPLKSLLGLVFHVIKLLEVRFRWQHSFNVNNPVHMSQFLNRK